MNRTYGLRVAKYTKGIGADERVEGITQLLDKRSRGDKTALDQLMPLVYDELRRLAKSFSAANVRITRCNQQPWLTKRIFGSSIKDGQLA